MGFGPGTSLQVLSLQVVLQLMLVDLMSKVVEPKVVEWTRLGREEIVPSNKKAFLMYKLFLLSQNIYVIYRSDISFVLGWGWALAQGLPFTSDHHSISGGSHDKGCGAKGCGMDKTRKERNCPRQEKSLSYVNFLLSPKHTCNLQKWHHICLGVRWQRLFLQRLWDGQD